MSKVADLIQDYGAYAGLAAVVGLSVLALLYFAQARELKRLREWTLEAADREADLARRMLAQAGRPGAARSIASRTGAMPSIPRAGAAGVGPATAAAAAAVAKVADPPTGAHAVTPPVLPSTPPTADAPDTTVVAPSNPPAPVPPLPGTPVTDTPPPAAPDGQAPMSAPATDDASDPPADGDKDAPATAPAGNDEPSVNGETVEGDALDLDEFDPDDFDLDPDSGPLTPLRSGASRPLRAGVPSVSLPARAAGEPLGRRRDTAPKKSGTGRLVGIAAGTIVGVLLAVLAATQLFGGDSTPDRQVESPAQTIDAGTAPVETTSTVPADPANVNVAVLNGTTVTGLAAQIADRLEQAGYVRGNVTNAAVQNRSATIVSYKEGSQGDAQRVAQRIGVGDDAIRPLDPAEASRAGDATVVVIVGADRTDLP